ncbi:acyltransferase [Janthinobacterium sp. SUN073]|uniref:acyltransferase family protein n=1 Tax=Janthinobacterium sp. SUN073 TaxID=3004102 RepID=UPI0025B18AD8|nr:acyltransferase [Janthinobacterium sp. SUN073]MDN2696108.1 acyltransferase [Janthinobacterium sp. SUN073]
MKSKFRYSLENFRGIAIIFVMFSHIMSIQGIGKLGGYLYYIVGDATTWFVFISGYLFYYLEANNFKYGAYLMKKVKYVILPYLILSIPVIFFWLSASQNVLYGLTPLNFMLWSLIAGGIAVGPMWFIPMIALFFTFTPAFRFLARTKAIYIVTLTFLIFSMFSSRSIYNANAFLSFLHFFGFYMLGIVAAKDAAVLERLKTETKKKIIFISILAFIFFGYFFPGMASMPNSFFNGLGLLNYILVGKLFLLIAIFFIFEQYYNRENKSLGYLARISFGLFFAHGFMAAIFAKVLKSINYIDPIVTLFAEIGVVIFVSIGIVVLVKKVLKKWSRYVIGC